jgi:hypothetical protein
MTDSMRKMALAFVYAALLTPMAVVHTPTQRTVPASAAVLTSSKASDLVAADNDSDKDKDKDKNKNCPTKPCPKS